MESVNKRTFVDARLLPSELKDMNEERLSEVADVQEELMKIDEKQVFNTANLKMYQACIEQNRLNFVTTMEKCRERICKGSLKPIIDLGEDCLDLHGDTQEPVVFFGDLKTRVKKLVTVTKNQPKLDCDITIFENALADPKLKTSGFVLASRSLLAIAKEARDFSQRAPAFEKGLDSLCGGLESVRNFKTNTFQPRKTILYGLESNPYLLGDKKRTQVQALQNKLRKLLGASVEEPETLEVREPKRRRNDVPDAKNIAPDADEGAPAAGGVASVAPLPTTEKTTANPPAADAVKSSEKAGGAAGPAPGGSGTVPYKGVFGIRQAQ